MSHAHSGMHDAHQELLSEWDSRPAADSGHHDGTMYQIKLCVMLDLTANRGLSFESSGCHTKKGALYRPRRIGTAGVRAVSLKVI